MHYEDQIDIGPEDADRLWRIFEYCNGRNSIQAISELTSLDLDEVAELITELAELELVVDSRSQYLHFHRVSNYPTPFNRDLTQEEVAAYTNSPRREVKAGKTLNFAHDKGSALCEILKRRRSCRQFSGRKLSLDQIGSMCHYAYSIKEHSVPSGGALYPLKIYVLVERDQNGIDAGYYEYDAERDHLVLFESEVDEEQLKYCFNQETMPFGSSVQIVIAADLERQAYKYANRGYRLTLIEAGHAAENISLYCAEQGLGACELGGVLDEPLKDELQLGDAIYPILAIAVGYQSRQTKVPIDKIRFAEANTGKGKIAESCAVQTFGKDGAFFGVSVEYLDNGPDPQYAGATSVSYADARFKATVEGYERWLCTVDRSTCFGSARELKGRWLDPRKYVPLTEAQAAKCGVAVFDEDLPIGWTMGKDAYDDQVYVPSDIVYYGHISRGNQIYFANSSGVAAYTDFREAEVRALTELIERDAIMRNWYSHRSPKIVAYDALPVHAKKRARHWAAQGRDLFVLEMPSAYGWVFMVIIVSEKYPCFVSGAAAALTEQYIPQAVHKALQEAEYSLLSSIKYPSASAVDPQSVITPADHDKLYHQAKYAETLAWLWSGETAYDFGQRSRGRSFAELKEDLQTVTVELSDPHSELSVVRVLSPKLVPINFGADSAHYTHSELQGKVHPDSLILPHYFA